MPTFTSPFDSTIPAGTRSKVLGDNDIREFKVQFAERMGVDHHILLSEGSDTNVGYHDKVSFVQKNTDYAAITALIQLFGKLDGSYTELFGVHENAGVIQYTVLGKLNVAAFGIASAAQGDIIVRGASAFGRLGIGSAYQRPRVNSGATALEYSDSPKKTFLWFIPSSVSTGTRKSARIYAGIAGTITKCLLDVGTAPVGSDIIVDINKNGSTIWATQGNRAKIIAGASTGNTTTFDTTSVAVGDYFDIDLDQVGSTTAGSDLTVLLEITPQ